MLTLGKMERALREAIRSENVRVIAHPMSDACGLVNIDSPVSTIVVDPMSAGLLNVVAHELVHLVYQKELSAWGRLEEPIVEALEDQMVRFINRNPRRIEWWRNRIFKKLSAGGKV